MGETSAERKARWDREGTPPLEEFLPLYEADDNEWWALSSGQQQNLFDSAVDRWEQAEAMAAAAVPAIPAEGPVLFVLTVPEGHDTDDAQAMVGALKRTVDRVAPGRGRGLVLSDGLQLDVLDDSQLRGLGLQRIPEGEG